MASLGIVESSLTSPTQAATPSPPLKSENASKTWTPSPSPPADDKSDGGELCDVSGQNMYHRKSTKKSPTLGLLFCVCIYKDFNCNTKLMKEKYLSSWRLAWRYVVLTLKENNEREGLVEGAPVTNQTPVGISIFIKTSDMQSNWNPNYSRNIYDCLNLRALNAKRKKSKTNNITFG